MDMNHHPVAKAAGCAFLPLTGLAWLGLTLLLVIRRAVFGHEPTCMCRTCRNRVTTPRP